MDVELRTRDEHCPPHVHVENEAARWEARLAFSFVGDLIRLVDVDPIEAAPGMRAIDRIKSAIIDNLAKCRAEWWMKVGTCCLDNRWVRLSRDGRLTALARREVGAAHIGGASYEPRSEQLTVTMKGGTDLTMKAGAGEDQWEP